MFLEFKTTEGMNLPIMSKILAEEKTHEKSQNIALVFESKDLTTPTAVVEFDLVLAFSFLIDALADQGVAMDHFLATNLIKYDLSFIGKMMESFVRFRRAKGIELDEDREFLNTKNIGLFLISRSK
jgi:hypothetical protein